MKWHYIENPLNDTGLWGLVGGGVGVHQQSFNPFHPVPDSELGAAEQSCPPAPDSESGAETHFIKLVLEVIKLCILMKEYSNCNPLPSAIPMCHNQSKFHWISSYFTISWASTDVTHSGRWGVCWQNSDFDPAVADSLSSYSSKQVCKTSLQDSLQITDSFQTLFDAEDIVVTLQIAFLRLSSTAER